MSTEYRTQADGPPCRRKAAAAPNGTLLDRQQLVKTMTNLNQKCNPKVPFPTTTPREHRHSFVQKKLHDGQIHGEGAKTENDDLGTMSGAYISMTM